MLRINDLNISAGNFSVNSIHLSVPDGSCHVLLGGTGNGKTLILESIAGLRPIRNGEILIDERNISNDFPENRFISYVPQDLALFPHLNVEKNIFYPKRFKKSHSRSDEEIREIIERLQIGHLMNRSIHNLSGGEQQRVALARAFASGNKVLLLDEPFSALHYNMKRALWSMLLDIKNRYSLSILMVTHDLEEAFFLADYISVLHKGEILQTGKLEDITRNPAHIEVTKMTGHYNYFLGEIQSINSGQCLVYFDKLRTELMTENIEFNPSDKVVLAIRTSDVGIIPLNKSTPDIQNSFTCRIKNVHETGHFLQIVTAPDQQLDRNPEDIVIDVYDREKTSNFEIGQRVTVFFPTDAILIFKDKF